MPFCVNSMAILYRTIKRPTGLKRTRQHFLYLAVDGIKFKVNNNRDKNIIPAKAKRRVEEIKKSIGRYFARLDQTEPDSLLTC